MPAPPRAAGRGPPGQRLDALEDWIARAEPGPGQKTTGPAADCIPRAADAFTALHGRRANRGVDDHALAGPAGLAGLLYALDATPTPVADPGTLRDALTHAPGAAALVIARPPARPGALPHIARIPIRHIATPAPTEHAPAPLPEDVAALEASRLRREQLGHERERRRAELYRGLVEQMQLRVLDVPGNGDCYYASIIEMFGADRLRPFTDQVREPGEEDTPPTPALLRRHLAGVLEADFERANSGQPALYAAFFPGTTTGDDAARAAQATVLADIGTPPRWDNDAGDRVAEVAARGWGLPMTLLGHRYGRDIGPPAAPPGRDSLYRAPH